jgi:hypothetical protein
MNVHTTSMNPKSASFLALIGMVPVSVVLIVRLLLDILNALRGLIPAATVALEMIYAFAAVTVAVFFYVFYKSH